MQLVASLSYFTMLYQQLEIERHDDVVRFSCGLRRPHNRRVAAIMLSRQLWTADKWWPIVWGLGGITNLLTHSFINGSTAFLGPWPLLQFRNLFSTDGRLLGRLNSSSEGRYLHRGQQKHRINARTHTHPCLEWDSNPRSQRSSERRQHMPKTARPQWSVTNLPSKQMFMLLNTLLLKAKFGDNFKENYFWNSYLCNV
jgi:hypothetical protein